MAPLTYISLSGILTHLSKLGTVPPKTAAYCQLTQLFYSTCLSNMNTMIGFRFHITFTLVSLATKVKLNLQTMVAPFYLIQL